MNILVVEDDLRLSEALNEILTLEKYKVDIVHDGLNGLEYGKSSIYDVIILDVMLPNMSGFEVIKSLRESMISTPIILLTAKSTVADRVIGLDYGADDYLTKPFSTDELLARLRALLRRPEAINMNEIEYGDVTLCLSSSLLLSHNKSIKLNYKEFHLMKLLMIHAGKIITKEDIIIKVWGIHSDANDNNVEAYISFLRKKLNYLQSCISIKTIRKIGYKLEENHV